MHWNVARWIATGVMLLGLAAIGVPLDAQMATGTVSGRVLDSGELAVPGVTVTARSSALQGARTVVTTQNGDYILPQLPPGEYTITYEIGGFAPARQVRNLAAGQTVTLDVTLSPATVQETVTVTGRTDAFTNTVQAATNFTAELLSELPTTRTIVAAVDLAPSVHRTGPNNAISINGAMSFENVFLLNGVQIQDNLRGTPLNLYIEDALQETTIVTSGVSAEYGRFSGGVVNAVTKSGGNRFSGSLRTTLANDNWRSTTPFREPKADATFPTYEFTLGGPILRDRTWFFGAGRLFESTGASETIYTRRAYETTTNEKRFEGKITQSLWTGHSVRASYSNLQRDESNYAFQQVMDFESLQNRQLPQELTSVHYTGALGGRFFVEGQYARRGFRFENSGGLYRDVVRGTLVLDGITGARYGAPTFCAVCGAEERNNDNVVLKANYFLSTGAGAHNLVAGYDTFNDIRKANNHQSASDYRLFTSDTRIVDATPFPVMRPDLSAFVVWNPILESSRGTDFRTHSFFVNDTWAVNRYLTLTLGLRYDANRGKDSADALRADDSAWSPRLGAVWDPTGSGRWSMNASYGKYVSAIANTIGDAASAAGNPAQFVWYYQGPEINTGTGPYADVYTALGQIFDWFEAAGGVNQAPISASVPGIAIQFRESLRSPHTREFAGGVSRTFSRGALRADALFRDFNDFYASRTDTTTGQVVMDAGGIVRSLDLTVVENTSEVERRYASMAIQGNYRATSWLDLGGNYTLSRLWGDVVGETSASGPVRTGILAYPEYFDPAWSNPSGDLSQDQRHRARVWGTLRVPFAEEIVRTSVGIIYQAQSGTPYGAAGSVRTGNFVTNPGYLQPPTSVTYYFTDRDAFRTETMHRTDVSVNVSRQLAAGGPELFGQFQLVNLFNQTARINLSSGTINTFVLTAVDRPAVYQAFDPFTTAPVQGVHWDYAPAFGTATGASAYTTPRTFQFAVGVRF